MLQRALSVSSYLIDFMLFFKLLAAVPLLKFAFSINSSACESQVGTLFSSVIEREAAACVCQVMSESEHRCEPRCALLYEKDRKTVLDERLNIFAN